MEKKLFGFGVNDTNIFEDTIIAEIDKIIDRLKTRCNPNPLGTTEKCLVAAEIEVLELVKGTIAKMKKENLSTKAVGVGLQLRDALIVDGVERETAEVFAAVAQQKFIDGANWQKKQDADLGSSAYERGYHDGREYEKGKSQKSNQDNSELADIEDSGEVKRVAEKWVRTYDKIYEKGKADIKKEMLKDAVEIEYWDGSLFCNELREKYKDGDKVKIIIIKED